MLDERERVFAPLQANPRRDVHPPFIAGNSNFSAFDRTRSSFSNLANGTPILHEFTRKPIIPDRFYVLSFYTHIRILIACIYLLSWNLNADKWSEIILSYRTIFISLTSLRYLIIIREETATHRWFISFDSYSITRSLYAFFVDVFHHSPDSSRIPKHVVNRSSWMNFLLSLLLLSTRNTTLYHPSKER